MDRVSFQIGENVGDYRILAVLGAGGAGEVYKAEHAITKRVEAIKILARGRPHGAEEEQRFLREIQLQASLDHPNIASVYNAFSTSHGLALAMELVEGESLEAILQRGRIPLETGTGYILQVLAALDHAHSHSVLHRDVKPGNIVVTPNGTVKLTDFGLARQPASPHLTDTGFMVGSPAYMSPEQINGLAPLDARADIYSLGVVLYEVAVGRKPFESASSFAAMQAHVESTPAPPIEIEPGVGPALNSVILTALAKNPKRRFQSAAEFRDALEAARQALPAAPVRAGARRTLRLVTVVALAVAVVIVAAMIQTGARTRVSPPVAVETPPPPPPPAPPPSPPPESAVIPPAPKMVPIPRPTALPRPKAPAEPPEVTVERPPEPVQAPGVEAPAPKGPEPSAAPQASPKKRNPLRRLLGKIPGPWKSRDKAPPR